MLTTEMGATPSVVQKLCQGSIPQGFESNSMFLNYSDASEYFQNIIRAAILMLPGVGASKEQNKDCHYFEMAKHNYELTRSLAASGWRQVHCVVRLNQIEGLKKKKTHYPVHYWTKDDLVILAKVKIEGKYIPEGSL